MFETTNQLGLMGTSSKHGLVISTSLALAITAPTSPLNSESSWLNHHPFLGVTWVTTTELTTATAWIAPFSIRHSGFPENHPITLRSLIA